MWQNPERGMWDVAEPSGEQAGCGVSHRLAGRYDVSKALGLLFFFFFINLHVMLFSLNIRVIIK